jgi:hypothetical protein
MAYRKFSIFTEPHVADPAWIAPVWDITEETPKMFSNADELLKIAQETRDNLMKAQARQKAIDETLKILGVSHDEYFTKYKEFRTRNSIV